MSDGTLVSSSSCNQTRPIYRHLAYVDLKMMEKAGLIHGLRCQVTFRLEVNSSLVCRYIADFTYFMKGSLVQVIEDAKGYQTPEYLLKKKLMLQQN